MTTLSTNRLRFGFYEPVTGQDLLLLLELHTQHLALHAQLLLLLGQLCAQLGRLPQDIHLGSPLLVPDGGDLFLQSLEEVLQANATLTLHVVVLITLLDRIGLVQAHNKVLPEDTAAGARAGGHATGSTSASLPNAIHGIHILGPSRQRGYAARRRGRRTDHLLAATLLAHHSAASRHDHATAAPAGEDATWGLQAGALALVGTRRGGEVRVRTGAGTARVHGQRRVGRRGGGAVLVRCARWRWIARVGHRFHRTAAGRRVRQIEVVVASLLLHVIDGDLVGHLGLQGAHHVARGIRGQLLVRVRHHIDFLICKDS